MKKSDKLKAYTIIMPTYAPVGIFLTYDIAIRFCESSYGKKWELKGIRIEKTTSEHVKIIKG